MTRKSVNQVMWGIISGVVLSFLLLLTFGCGFIGSGDIFGLASKDEGEVVIKLYDSGIGSKTILPGINMVIHHYDITGTGPTNFNRTVIKPDNSLVLTLKLGNYSMTVSGQNSGHEEIGLGSDTFSITPQLTTNVSITITPVAGTGTFTASIQYPIEVITTPVMDVNIKPVDGGYTDISSGFNWSSDVTYGYWSYSDTYNAGWYLLLLKLIDDADQVYGIVEAMRIVQSEITPLTLTLTEENFNLLGQLDSLFPEEMNNPIQIDWASELPTTVERSTNVTLQAVPSEAVDSYSWYLNAELETETIDTYVFNEPLLGVYVISVVVQKGNTLSSKSHQVTVYNPVLTSFTIEPAGGGNIGPQNVGVPFDIDIYALDQYDNYFDFNGTVDITDITTTILPIVSGTFTAGKLFNQTVTVNATHATDVITVTESGGTATGNSNAFPVNP